MDEQAENGAVMPAGRPEASTTDPSPVEDPDADAGAKGAPVDESAPAPPPEAPPAAEPAEVATEPDADVATEPDAESGVPADSERIDAVLLAVERLNMRVEELARLSQRQVDHIDRLHTENQQLRTGELRQAMSPVLKSLVRHHDNLAKMAEAAGDNAGEARALDDARTGLLNVLSIAGVESFEAAPEEPFDASRHQGVSSAETDDVALDGKVARLRRCGFVADDGRVVRPADVDVYRVR